jgi:hypothetical protein
MRNIKSLLAVAMVAIAAVDLHAQAALSEHHASEKTKASHWMKNFELQKGGTLAYLYGKQIMKELASTKDCSGAYIFLAMENNKETIVFKPFNKDGVMFKGLAFEEGTQCPPYCTPCEAGPCKDENNLSKIGKRIEEGMAVEMIEKYRSIKPTHDAFFLEQSFLKTLLSRRDVEAVYFANGLDELGQEHLILIGVSQENQLIWDGPVYYLNKTSLPDYPQYPVAKTK